MEKELFYKLNVRFPVGVRKHPRDTQGLVLTPQNPYVEIDEADLRNFKIANKHAILEGMIIPSEAPTIDWETPNALTDEEITELLKNYLKLKQSLQTIDSLVTLQKILQAAKEQDKSEKIRKLIQSRIAELDDSEITSPDEMQGVV